MYRPHVGILFEFPTLNGGEHSLLAMLRHLQADGFALTAIAPAAGPLSAKLTASSVPVIPFSVRNDHGVKRDTQQLHEELRAIITAAGFDILHANSLSMSRLSGQLDDVSPQTRRTGHLRDIMRLSNAAVADLNKNDGLIAVSRATYDFHIRQGLAADRCTVVHNGVDANLFRRKARPDRTENPVRLPEGACLILNVGQICLRKNQLALARAVCELLQTRDDLHLVLAGARHSGKRESHEHESAIEAEFQTAGRRDHLHLPGYCEDIASLMNHADLLVHTARQEPFGRTLLEAASSELPIVATAVGGTPEMLRDDVDAILIEADNHRALCNAIQTALSDPVKTRQRTKAARARIQAEFDVTTAAQKTGEFWQAQWGTSAASR